ncbi:MAG: hypothetical protein ACHQ03_05140 [Candidatus Bathyarchaeia archaeon]
MRPNRIGTRDGIRALFCSIKTLIGSRRFLWAFQPAWLLRGVASRNAFPAAIRSSIDRADFLKECFSVNPENAIPSSYSVDIFINYRTMTPRLVHGTTLFSCCGRPNTDDLLRE